MFCEASVFSCYLLNVDFVIRLVVSPLEAPFNFFVRVIFGFIHLAKFELI